MSAQIIELITDDAINKAWDNYARHAGRLIGEPRLIADRAFNEDLARRHERWLRLFLAKERIG